MNIFTYENLSMFELGLIDIEDLGVDFESYPDNLTIVSGELTSDECNIMTYNSMRVSK